MATKGPSFLEGQTPKELLIRGSLHRQLALANTTLGRVSIVSNLVSSKDL